MDIETTPRVEFLEYNLDVHKRWAEDFAQRLKNIEDNPEPDEKVRVVVFYHNGQAVDSAVRAPFGGGSHNWYLTGVEEPQTWEQMVDDVASVRSDYKITAQYVLNLEDILGKG